MLPTPLTALLTSFLKPSHLVTPTNNHCTTNSYPTADDDATITPPKTPRRGSNTSSSGSTTVGDVEETDEDGGVFGDWVREVERVAGENGRGTWWGDDMEGDVKEEDGHISHRELFYRLMNVEDYPDVLPIARTFLQSQLRLSAIQAAHDAAASKLTQTTPPATLGAAMRNGYDPAALESFMLAQHQRTMDAYHEYRAGWDRRMEEWETLRAKTRKGDDEEVDEEKEEAEALRYANTMFPSRAFAEWWLLQNAPTKLVDGAWLQHVVGSGTSAPSSSDSHSPFPPTTTTSPQPHHHHTQAKRTALPLYTTFIEELGDGILPQNHVTVYTLTLSSTSPSLPPAHSSTFAHTPTILTPAFTRGCIQLALGQFSAHEFFPEALGYNLGYEQLPLHLLVTSWEFERMGLDATYFLLHVSIDNAANGHARLAVDAVRNYLEWVRTVSGVDVMNEHWQRIVAGFYLSERNPLQPHIDRRRQLERSLTTLTSSPTTTPTPHQILTHAVSHILARKSPYAHRIHSPHSRLGSHPLHYWLDPAHIHTRKDELVEVLSREKRWVWRGRPERSGLLAGLCGFGGPMFAVFDEGERRVLGEWIRGLSGDKDEVEVEGVSTQRESGGKCPVSGLTTTGPTCPFAISRSTDTEQPGSDTSSISDSPPPTSTYTHPPALLSLLRAKSRLGRTRHNTLTLQTPTGSTIRINDLLARGTPGEIADAIVASGMCEAFARACEVGGCMERWFNGEERGVVWGWVREVAENSDSADAQDTAEPTRTVSASADPSRPQAAGADSPSEFTPTLAAQPKEFAADPDIVSLALDILSTATSPSTTPLTHPPPTPLPPLPALPTIPFPTLTAVLRQTSTAGHILARKILDTPIPEFTSMCADTAAGGRKPRPTTGAAILPLLRLLALGVPLDRYFTPARHPTALGAALVRFRRAWVESAVFDSLIERASVGSTISQTTGQVQALVVHLLAVSTHPTHAHTTTLLASLATLSAPALLNRIGKMTHAPAREWARFATAVEKAWRDVEAVAKAEMDWKCVERRRGELETLWESGLGM
ncbi:uncharacterized protein EV422DRAFT_86350 [Fimicolochytrium jonesii]|uniref:uncharacterized protein n=1 Tax=Fimicolochytrium jonesii TaxID=1396493 RepID=UPI0022FDD68E|nr:uncharacterized protein EV422DRAFT_86350 [Fimicolochytrium jonesii]KAI8820294.1 hypothetical protein EV422DRAFT_86350 [Fimicolochytrium jonesii]